MALFTRDVHLANQQFSVNFNQNNVEEVFEKLTSVDSELRVYYEDYIVHEYFEPKHPDRLFYFDISRIAAYLVEKMKARQNDFFASFFLNVEEILCASDTYVEELIIIGLFEGLQNLCASEIDYHFEFDNWLGPISKLKWNGLIDFWEKK